MFQGRKKNKKKNRQTRSTQSFDSLDIDFEDKTSNSAPHDIFYEDTESGDRFLVMRKGDPLPVESTRTERSFKQVQNFVGEHYFKQL